MYNLLPLEQTNLKINETDSIVFIMRTGKGRSGYGTGKEWKEE